MESGVLFVSPYQQDADSLAQMLDGIGLVHALNLNEAASKMETEKFQVVLSEAKLEDGNWLDILQLANAVGMELVVTDPWADARFWAEAISRGAYDLLAQPFHGTEVRRVLSSASSRKSGYVISTGA